MGALIIGAALGSLAASRLFFRLPVLEIGFVIAAFVSPWLFWAIFNSGHF